MHRVRWIRTEFELEWYELEFVLEYSLRSLLENAAIIGNWKIHDGRATVDRLFADVRQRVVVQCELGANPVARRPAQRQAGGAWAAL